MSEDRDPYPLGGGTFPVVAEGRDGPWFTPWVYIIAMVGVALWVGLTGPFNGWWALLAALVAAAITYVAVAVAIGVILTIDFAVGSWWDHRQVRKSGSDFYSNSHRGLRRALPIRVDQVHCSPDRLEIRGGRGHMTFAFQPWRVTDHDGVRFGWSSVDVAASVQSLCGHRIVDFITDQTFLTALIFDNGWHLELFHDNHHRTRGHSAFELRSYFVSWLRRRLGADIRKHQQRPRSQEPT